MVGILKEKLLNGKFSPLFLLFSLFHASAKFLSLFLRLGISMRSQTPKVDRERSQNTPTTQQCSVPQSSDNRSTITLDTKKNLPKEERPREMVFQNYPQRQSPFTPSTNQCSENVNRNQNQNHNQNLYQPPRTAIYSRGEIL